MKVIVLPVTTLSVVLLTGAVLYGAGWFTPRSQQPHGGTHEQRPSEAAVHYRQNNASHWRSYVMQP